MVSLVFLLFGYHTAGVTGGSTHVRETESALYFMRVKLTLAYAGRVI